MSGYVVGADYDDTMQIDDTTWYYKDVTFPSQRSAWPNIVVSYISTNDAQDKLYECFVKNLSYTGFRLVFNGPSGNNRYCWIVN